jgi:hypothetical protein
MCMVKKTNRRLRFSDGSLHQTIFTIEVGDNFRSEIDLVECMERLRQVFNRTI